MVLYLVCNFNIVFKIFSVFVIELGDWFMCSWQTAKTINLILVEMGLKSKIMNYEFHTCYMIFIETKHSY